MKGKFHATSATSGHLTRDNEEKKVSLCISRYAREKIQFLEITERMRGNWSRHILMIKILFYSTRVTDMNAVRLEGLEGY